MVEEKESGPFLAEEFNKGSTAQLGACEHQSDGTTPHFCIFVDLFFSKSRSLFLCLFGEKISYSL